MDSDVSTDSFEFDQVMGKYGVQVTDTEFHEINSGLDRDEFRKKQRRKESVSENQGVRHLLY